MMLWDSLQTNHSVVRIRCPFTEPHSVLGSTCHITSCFKFHGGKERVVLVSRGDRMPDGGGFFFFYIPDFLEDWSQSVRLHVSSWTESITSCASLHGYKNVLSSEQLLACMVFLHDGMPYIPKELLFIRNGENAADRQTNRVSPPFLKTCACKRDKLWKWATVWKNDFSV